jgi:hypothetical protein
MPAVTVARSSTRRPPNVAPAGTSTLVGLPSSQTVAIRVGLVGVPVDSGTVQYRTSPATGATMPNSGFIVTLPVRLTLLDRSCRVGLAVVCTVPRGASPGSSGSAPVDVHAAAVSTTAASPHTRTKALFDTGPPKAIPLSGFANLQI